MPWAILGILLLGGGLVAAVTAAVLATRPRAPTAPVISSFTANLQHVCSGGALGLNWSASGGSATLSAMLGPAQSVDESLGAVGTSGSSTVHARTGRTGNVTFTLTVASPGFASMSQSVTVQVVGADGAYVPPLPAQNDRCGVHESGAAGGDEGGNPVIVPFDFSAWEGTNHLNGWDPNLVVSVLSLGLAAPPPRLVFVRKDSVVVRLPPDGTYLPLRGFSFPPISVDGTWTLFTQMLPGETCGGSTSGMPASIPPPMSVIIQVACPS